MTLGVILLWAVSRVVALPALGGPEPLGLADSLATLLEVAAVVGVLAGPRLPVPRNHSRVRRLLPLAAGALAMSAITTPALAATEAGAFARPHHGGGHSAAP